MSAASPFDEIAKQAQALGVTVHFDANPVAWSTGERPVSVTRLECTFEQAPLVRDMLESLRSAMAHRSESRYHIEGALDGHHLSAYTPVLGFHVGLVAARLALADPQGVKESAVFDFGVVRPSAEDRVMRLLQGSRFGGSFDPVLPVEDTLARLLLDAAGVGDQATRKVWVDDVIGGVLSQLGQGDFPKVALALHADDPQPSVVVAARPLPGRPGLGR